jgi:hypothetical protein
MIRRGGILLAILALLVGGAVAQPWCGKPAPENGMDGGVARPDRAEAPPVQAWAGSAAEAGREPGSAGTAGFPSVATATGGGAPSILRAPPVRAVAPTAPAAASPGDAVRGPEDLGGGQPAATPAGALAADPARNRPQQSAPYQPPSVIRAVEPEPGTGLRISAAVEVGFTFQPGHYRGGAMRIVNDGRSPVSVSFHGPGSAAVRLNGQPVVEGRQYRLATDIEIAGPAAVGVHLRRPGGHERDPAPQGVG